MSATEVFYITVCTNIALAGLMAILSLIHFGRRHQYIRLIGWLFAVGFACDVTAVALAFLPLGLGTYVNLPQSLYDFFHVILVAWIFYLALDKRYKWILIAAPIVLVLMLFNVLFVQTTDIASYGKFVASGLIIAYCIFYLYRVMAEMPSMHIHRVPMFWFSAGLLIYNAGVIFLFAFTSYIVRVLNDSLTLYWSFHNVLSILTKFIIAVGLIYDLRRLSTPAKPSRNR